MTEFNEVNENLIELAKALPDILKGLEISPRMVHAYKGNNPDAPGQMEL